MCFDAENIEEPVEAALTFRAFTDDVDEPGLLAAVLEPGDATPFRVSDASESYGFEIEAFVIASAGAAPAGTPRFSSSRSTQAKNRTSQRLMSVSPAEKQERSK